MLYKSYEYIGNLIENRDNSKRSEKDGNANNRKHTEKRIENGYIHINLFMYILYAIYLWMIVEYSQLLVSNCWF